MSITRPPRLAAVARWSDAVADVSDRACRGLQSASHAATAVLLGVCRRGVAQALIAACEAAALAAGFPDLYIQAALTVRDYGSPLGGWLSQV